MRTLPVVTLLSIDYDLKFIPKDISEAQKLKEKVGLVLRHLSGLGCLISGLTSEMYLREWLGNHQVEELREHRANLDGALNVFGQIVAGLAALAHVTIEEYAELVGSGMEAPLESPRGAPGAAQT